MARLLLLGSHANVEIEQMPLDDVIQARCVGLGAHSACGWKADYDGMDDAVEYAATDHADKSEAPA